MQRKFLIIGSTFALIAILLGAFGAHALKNIVDTYSIDIFETGIRYQFYHALALIILGFVSDKVTSSNLKYSGYLFIGGIILFSGSLYTIALKDVVHINLIWIGPITPIGGALFIIGWILFLLAIIKTNKDERTI